VPSTSDAPSCGTAVPSVNYGLSSPRHWMKCSPLYVPDISNLIEIWFSTSTKWHWSGIGWSSTAIRLCFKLTCNIFNPLTPNDHYSGRTAPLTSKRCILYIYSTNIGTEYFNHGMYSPFVLSSKCSLFHNSNIFGSCFIHILYTVCAKI